MAGATGFEPATSTVTGWRDNHYTTRPYIELAHYTTGSAHEQDYLGGWVEIDPDMIAIVRVSQPVIERLLNSSFLL